jgi:hypothetical protein
LKEVFKSILLKIFLIRMIFFCFTILMTTLQFYNNELQTEFKKLFNAKCNDTKTQRTILNHIDININSIEGLINNINEDLEKDDLNDLHRSVEFISDNVKNHLKSFFKQCKAKSKTKVNKNLYNIIKVKLNLIKKLLKDKYNLYERSVSNSVNSSLNSVPDENENNLVRLDLNLQSSRFGKKAKHALRTKKARRGAFKLNVAKQAESEAMKAKYAPIEAENSRRRANKAKYAPIEAENSRRRAEREAMKAKYAPIEAENNRRRAEREAMKAKYAPIEAENNRRRAKREANTASRNSPRKSNSVKSRKPRRRTSTSSPRRRTSTSSPRRRTSTSSPKRRTSTSSPKRRTSTSSTRRSTSTN